MRERGPRSRETPLPLRETTRSSGIHSILGVGAVGAGRIVPVAGRHRLQDPVLVAGIESVATNDLLIGEVELFVLVGRRVDLSERKLYADKSAPQSSVLEQDVGKRRDPLGELRRTRRMASHSGRGLVSILVVPTRNQDL